MLFSVYLFSFGIFLTTFANPLPSDMFYDELYGLDSEVQGDSLFGDIASADPNMEGFRLAEPTPQAASETENLWTSGSGSFDTLPLDSSQDPIIAENPDLLMSSCGGADIQKRDQLRTRDGSLCPSSAAPLKFKIPTIDPLSLPKKPPQTEIVPTLGRLRFGFSLGSEDPICSIEPYNYHLCCDGPMGEEALDFGQLYVYTPVKNCLPGTGIVPCSTPPPLDVCCQQYTPQADGKLVGVFCLKNSI